MRNENARQQLARRASFVSLQGEGDIRLACRLNHHHRKDRHEGRGSDRPGGLGLRGSTTQAAEQTAFSCRTFRGVPATGNARDMPESEVAGNRTCARQKLFGRMGLSDCTALPIVRRESGDRVGPGPVVSNSDVRPLNVCTGGSRRLLISCRRNQIRPASQDIESVKQADVN